jgi:hypothetical protein
MVQSPIWGQPMVQSPIMSIPQIGGGSPYNPHVMRFNRKK